MKNTSLPLLTLTGALFVAGVVSAQPVPPVTDAAAQVGTEVVSVEAVEAPGTVSPVQNAQPQATLAGQEGGGLSPAGVVPGSEAAGAGIKPHQSQFSSRSGPQWGRTEWHPSTPGIARRKGRTTSKG